MSSLRLQNFQNYTLETFFALAPRLRSRISDAAVPTITIQTKLFSLNRSRQAERRIKQELSENYRRTDCAEDSGRTSELHRCNADGLSTAQSEPRRFYRK